MKRKRFLALVAAALFLSSCSGMPKEIKAGDIVGETLYMRSDGSAQAAYAEEFKENYLDFEELKTYINDELGSYNLKFGETAAKLSDALLKDGLAKVILTFETAEIYEAFDESKGEKNVSFPKAAEVLEKFGAEVFKDAEERLDAKASDALSDEYNIAVINGFMNFQAEKKIRYYFGGTLIDNHHLRVDEGDKAVVVYSK